MTLSTSAWELVYSQSFSGYEAYASSATYVWWDVGTDETTTGEEIAAAIVASAEGKAALFQINVYTFGTDGKRWLIELWYYPLVTPVVPEQFPWWAWLLVGMGGITLIGGGANTISETISTITAMMPMMMMMFMMMIPKMTETFTPEKIERGVEKGVEVVTTKAKRVPGAVKRLVKREE